MHLLLSGHSGFLGSIIHKRLSDNYKIQTVGRSGVCDFAFDLANSEASIIDTKDDFIFVHVAGKAHSVPKTEAERQEFFTINYNGTVKLLKALTSNLPKAFVFISTISVYGLDEGEDITEEFPLNATEPYGLSKIKAEEAVVAWGKENNVTTAILRLPLIAGPNPPGNLGSMIQAIASSKYFSIGKADAKKCIVLGEDVAAIIPFAAQFGGTYNLTDGYHPSFSEIEATITQHLGKKSVPVMPKLIARIIGYAGDSINLVAQRRLFPLDSRAYRKITGTLTMSDAKAREKLGWKPRKVIDHLFE